jgi:hypothetical protein
VDNEMYAYVCYVPCCFYNVQYSFHVQAMATAIPPLLELLLELTFLKLYVGWSVIFLEFQGRTANDTLIAATSFSETRRNHTAQKQQCKEGQEPQPCI